VGLNFVGLSLAPTRRVGQFGSREGLWNAVCAIWVGGISWLDFASLDVDVPVGAGASSWWLSTSTFDIGMRWGEGIESLCLVSVLDRRSGREGKEEDDSESD
jgi:hypothetical protein